MFVKFYYPSKDNKGRILDEKKANSAYNSIVTKMCNEFGGATVTDGMGYYAASTGQLIAEPVRIIASYTSTLLDVVKDDFRRVASMVKTELSQESIMVEFGNEVEFI